MNIQINPAKPNHCLGNIVTLHCYGFSHEMVSYDCEIILLIFSYYSLQDVGINPNEDIRLDHTFNEPWSKAINSILWERGYYGVRVHLSRCLG